MYHIGDPLYRLFADSTPVAPQSPIERFHTTSRRPYSEMAAMLVFQTNPVGVELFSYANAFFFSKKIFIDAGRMSENTLLHPLDRILSLFHPKHFTVCHFIVSPSKRAIFQLENFRYSVPLYLLCPR